MFILWFVLKFIVELLNYIRISDEDSDGELEIRYIESVSQNGTTLTSYYYHFYEGSYYKLTCDPHKMSHPICKNFANFKCCYQGVCCTQKHIYPESAGAKALCQVLDYSNGVRFLNDLKMSKRIAALEEENKNLRERLDEVDVVIAEFKKLGISTVPVIQNLEGGIDEVVHTSRVPIDVRAKQVSDQLHRRAN